MPTHAYVFVVLLSLTAWFAATKGLTGMARSAIVTILNCLLGTAWVLATGVYDPWRAFLALNLASAIVVLVDPADRPQAIVGGMFVASCLIDGAYGAAGNPDAAGLYVFISATVGWGQLSVLFIGAADDDGGASRLSRWARGVLGALGAAGAARLAPRR